MHVLAHPRDPDAAARGAVSRPGGSWSPVTCTPRIHALLECCRYWLLTNKVYLCNTICAEGFCTLVLLLNSVRYSYVYYTSNVTVSVEAADSNTEQVAQNAERFVCNGAISSVPPLSVLAWTLCLLLMVSLTLWFNESKPRWTELICLYLLLIV